MPQNTNTEIQVAEPVKITAIGPASEFKEKFNTTLRMANAYAESTIVPQAYQKNASNCFIAIEMAQRMGANPFQVMQSLNIIQGKPSWSSAFIIAAVNQSGRFKTPLNYKVEGSWQEGTLSCIAYATSKDGTLCESIKVTQAMAAAEGWSAKSGSKWKTMPELMIRYRAAAFFGRQYCPDLLLGLLSTEEQRDIIDAEVTPINNDFKNATPYEVKQEQSQTTGSKKVDIIPEPQVKVDDNNQQLGFDFDMPE